MINKPTVRLMIVCADAVLNLPESMDFSLGWWVIHRPFHTVWMPPGISRKFGVNELYVYAQITDGIGEFRLGLTVEEVDLANPKRDRIMGRSEPRTISLENPWDVIEESFKLTKVPFPKPGQYRFQLTESGHRLDGGTAYLRVLAGDSS